jgi:signal peptidase I
VHLQSEHLTPGADESQQIEAERETFLARLWPIIREIIETLVLATIIWLVVNFATARYVVDGDSMEPNLHTGQFLIVSRLAYMVGDPAHGDIVVFHYPRNPEESYVKRVIGVPGDDIIIEGRQVYVNGFPIDEPYLSETAQSYSRGHYTATVPENSYFVLGDNRAGSSDSVNWGALERDLIIGKAWLSYWPPSEWGLIPHYRYDKLP